MLSLFVAKLEAIVCCRAFAWRVLMLVLRHLWRRLFGVGRGQAGRVLELVAGSREDPKEICNWLWIWVCLFEGALVRLAYFVNPPLWPGNQIFFLF